MAFVNNTYPTYLCTLQTWGGKRLGSFTTTGIRAKAELPHRVHIDTIFSCKWLDYAG